MCPGGWLLWVSRSPRICVVSANTDPEGPRRSDPESSRFQLLVRVVVYQIRVYPIHFCHGHGGHEFGALRCQSSAVVVFGRLLGSSLSVVVPLWAGRWCG